MSARGFSIVNCPDCHMPMRLARVGSGPTPFTDELTYRCDSCQREVKETVRSRSLGDDDKP